MHVHHIERGTGISHVQGLRVHRAKAALSCRWNPAEVSGGSASQLTMDFILDASPVINIVQVSNRQLDRYLGRY